MMESMTDCTFTQEMLLKLEQLGVVSCSMQWPVQSLDYGVLELKLDNEMSSSFMRAFSKHGLARISLRLLQRCGVLALTSMQADENGCLALRFASAHALAASVSAEQLAESVMHAAEALSTMCVDLDLEDAV